MFSTSPVSLRSTAPLAASLRERGKYQRKQGEVETDENGENINIRPASQQGSGVGGDAALVDGSGDGFGGGLQSDETAA